MGKTLGKTFGVVNGGLVSPEVLRLVNNLFQEDNKGMLFRKYSQYLKEKYGETVYRIGVDGGFSCPNRGPDRSRPGCHFCDAYGVRSAYIGEDLHSLKEQIHKSIAPLEKRYHARKYILYFQAYSSTWGRVEDLKKIYDTGLALGHFVELVVSTRTDCIDEEIASLLASYKNDHFDVWVELGLQSSHDESLKRMNRGHNRGCFEKAYHLLRKYNIKIAVHMIFGLPGEDRRHIQESIHYLASLKPEGVKFHNLHIPTGSVLYREYEAGELSFPDSYRHVLYVADALERLPPETIVMRMTTDTPRLRHRRPGIFLELTIYIVRMNQVQF